MGIFTRKQQRVIDYVAIAAACILTATVVSCATARAATFDVNPNPAFPGQYVIYLKGKVELDDDKKFERIINTQLKDKPVVVVLDSPGGFMLPGLLIGYSIHDHGYNTSVRADKTCTSICAEIWLAGTKRYASHTADIGFHSMGEPVRVRTGKRSGKEVMRRSDRGNKFLTEYHSILGIGKAANDYLMAVDPNDITWFNDVTAAALKIEFTWNDPGPEQKSVQQDSPFTTNKAELVDRRPNAPTPDVQW